MLTRRDWAGVADLPGLILFCQRIWTPDTRWHIGDLAWDIGRAPQGRPNWRMSLWEQDGEIIAWGWLVVPDRLSLVLGGDHAHLIDAVVDWACDIAGARVSVTALSTEGYQTEPLVRRGYVPDYGGHFFVAHHRSLADIPAPSSPPDGFTVRPVRGDDEIPARAALEREVWAPSELTDDGYRAIARRWPYSYDFDWVAVAPDGRLVSYVLGWYDEVNRVGQFEPVGTLASFRRRGLSRAVGTGVLRAFRDAGGERAVVYARGDDEYPVPRQVYTALGFRARGRTVTYCPSA